MRKLIELGGAIDTAIGATDEYDGGYNFERDRKIKDALMALPTIDAVPVVRCKDCKHYRPYAGIEDGYCHMAEWYKRYQYENDFCSRGERKDGDHEID